KLVATLPAASLHLLAVALRETKAVQPAVVLLRKAQQRYPGDFWINFQLAFCLCHPPRPQWEESLRFWTAAVALRTEHPVLHMNLGVVLSQTGRSQDAVAALRRAIELNGDDASAHCNLGVALFNLGRYQEALAAQRRAIALAPDYAAAHNNLGGAL